MEKTTFRPSHKIIQAHWEVLCNQIGVRLAGGPAEQAAADYIENRFRALSLDAVEQQRFLFPNWWTKKLNFKVGRTRPTRPVPCGPWAYSPFTGPKGVTGRLVYLQNGSELDFKNNNLKGQIGLIIGSLASLMDPKFKKSLARSGLAGVLMVDSRIPYADRCPGGCAPQWAAGLTVPMAAVPFRKAIDLVNALPLKARLTCTGRYSMDPSQNVVGQITGRRWPEQVILISGHHDSVWGCVGANDNASGVIFTLELARLLRGTRPARTIRFVSYGVEERLSVGAYVYARSLGSQAQNVRLAINADGVGSRVGHDRVIVTAGPQAHRFVKDHYRRARHPARVLRAVTIYSDHFPLNIVGVPSFYMGRPSLMQDGHWTLHLALDNVDNVDPAPLARTVATTASLIHRLASAPRFPVARTFGKDLLPDIRRGAKEGYGHPWPMKKIKDLWTLMPPDRNWQINP